MAQLAQVVILLVMVAEVVEMVMAEVLAKAVAMAEEGADLAEALEADLAEALAADSEVVEEVDMEVVAAADLVEEADLEEEEDSPDLVLVRLSTFNSKPLVTVAEADVECYKVNGIGTSTDSVYRVRIQMYV